MLGSKNPCYVDQNCDIATTAQRIAWARFHNAGQSLVAPDYILCHTDVKAQLVQALKGCLTQFYGSKPQESCSFGRMINLEIFNRMKDILWRSGKVAMGGQVIEAEKYIGENTLGNFRKQATLNMQDIWFLYTYVLFCLKPQQSWRMWWNQTPSCNKRCSAQFCLFWM